MKKILIVLLSLIIVVPTTYYFINNNEELNNKISKLEQEKVLLNNKIFELEKKKEKSFKNNIKVFWKPLKKKEVILSCKLSLWSTLIIEKWTTEAKSDNWIQNTPLELIFSWINTNKVVLKWNQWETELLKIDNWDVIYLLERTWGWYVNIFSYFTKTWNIIYSKQYSLFGTTFWTQLIWYCN